MKKILLGTSAIVLAGAMAAPASAAEWEMEVGGFFTGGFGFLSDDWQDEQSAVIVSDGEIHFDPSITLDNGIKIGAHIEMEANSGSTDEYNAFVTGSFGTVEIGAQDGAQDKMSGGIPAGPFSGPDGGLNDYFGLSIGVDGSSSGDALKVTYVTPSIAGFQAAASYIPDNSSEGSTTSGNNGDDSFEVGAKYGGSFGDVSLNLGVGYLHDGAASGSMDDHLGVTGSVGFAGFSLGAGYQSDDDGDMKNWGIGASYATGPWALGVHYAENDYDNSDDWNAAVSAGYTVAAGVSTGVSVEFSEVDDEDLLGGALWLALSF